MRTHGRMDVQQPEQPRNLGERGEIAQPWPGLDCLGLLRPTLALPRIWQPDAASLFLSISISIFIFLAKVALSVPPSLGQDPSTLYPVMR